MHHVTELDCQDPNSAPLSSAVTRQCPETSRFGRHLLDACRAAGFESRVAHYANEPIARLALVSAGRGVALMPKSLQRVSCPGMRFCPLAGAPLNVDLYMAWRAADPSAVVANFRRLVAPLPT